MHETLLNANGVAFAFHKVEDREEVAAEVWDMEDSMELQHGLLMVLVDWLEAH